MCITLRLKATLFLMLASANVSAFSEGRPPLPTVSATGPMTFVVTSRESGEQFIMRISVPERMPPHNGFPVLFILDGNILFNTFADAVRNRSMAGEIEPAVVVGISSAPGTKGGNRTFDFTWTDLTDREKTVIKDLGDHPRWGGAQAFYGTLQSEMKAKVAATATINPAKESLIGWSLGGLFVIHTMFEHPGSFSTYVSLSPSLWRSNRIIFDDIEPFARRLDHASTSPRILLGVGGNEERPPPGMHNGGMTSQELIEELRYCRMVTNFGDFTHRLGPVLDSHAIEWTAKVFDGESHNSVPWAAVNTILDFILPLHAPESAH
ncbi:alpha/beta hydrolase [Luteibacter aegosomatissinici]|uniref:alpha/beta hydrolase n=1 Tax=Luteibacter aegosomatissinici TaxID=2911539 RepID=UPI001FF8FC79|nr:alpha/beta hydrolase-fold protein [Luteibacter aegosomatissinici]UPG92775.1 alpha/beta hydrolase-fold protein [Luteibacter aegosomatissinici]